MWSRAPSPQKDSHYPAPCLTASYAIPLRRRVEMAQPPSPWRRRSTRCQSLGSSRAARAQGPHTCAAPARMSTWPSLWSMVSSASRGSSAQSLVAPSSAGGGSSRWDDEDDAMAMLWRATMRCRHDVETRD
jgi:hypothetical protein